MTRQAKVFALRLVGVAAALVVAHSIGTYADPVPVANPSGTLWVVGVLYQTLLGAMAMMGAAAAVSLIAAGLAALWPETTVEDREQADKRKLEKERLSNPDFDPLGVRDKINRK